MAGVVFFYDDDAREVWGVVEGGGAGADGYGQGAVGEGLPGAGLGFGVDAVCAGGEVFEGLGDVLGSGADDEDLVVWLLVVEAGCFLGG